MYKITLHGKTLVGCNEDAWRLTSRIWFEPTYGQGRYGAAFTGSRYDGDNGFAPQSGMNEAGLVFSRLASHTPENAQTLPSYSQKIVNPTQYLKDILHTCKTVEEVKAYISRYDYSYFKEDIFIYIDKSGKYLVVEPFLMHMGNDAHYVLSNFCPSATPKKDAFRLDRYRKGVLFLKDKIDTTLRFCTALSDTMHVSREKIDDGTLLTSIWDTENGVVNLYFYHDYKHSVQFVLKDELKKGARILEIPQLFPPNPAFQKLAHYKIPQNTFSLALLLMGIGIFCVFSFCYFVISYFANPHAPYRYFTLCMSFVNIITFYYMIVLCKTMSIFYFSAPYFDAHSLAISLSSYTPFLILLLLVSSLFYSKNIWKSPEWHLFSKYIWTLNQVFCVILIALFGYWGLFDIL